MLPKKPQCCFGTKYRFCPKYGEKTNFGDVKIVDVNIRRLRMKIEDEPSNPKYLTTVWGYGYKWSVNE